MSSLISPTAVADPAATQDPFDPSEEYRKLLELTAAEPSSGGRERRASRAVSGESDAYQALMAKERRVLDTVDRVVNDSILSRAAAESALFGMPVHELVMRTVGAMRALFDDLVASRTLAEAGAAVRDPQRRPFLGVALVAAAVFAGMLAHLA